VVEHRLGHAAAIGRRDEWLPNALIEYEYEYEYEYDP
jgi:hypothetical protein